MIIYFLIENFDVDHSPQCFENTDALQHNTAVHLILGRWTTNPNKKKFKKKTFQRELPSSECNTFLSTLHFRKMENGKKTIKLDRQVDQKIKPHQ